MVVWMGEPGGEADDPFEVDVATPGILTHGHLAENDNHGGQPDTSYLDMTKLPSAPASDRITIEDFVYGEGDMSFAASVPTVRPGGTIEFDNLDSPLYRGLWHTITSCAAPCNDEHRYCLPDRRRARSRSTAASSVSGGPPTAERTTWSVPTDLPEGTYTYFCRIHPLMRGAFRVEGEPVDGASTTIGG